MKQDICKITKSEKSMRIRALVHGISTEFLVDTGASCTLVSQRIFQLLKDKVTTSVLPNRRKFQLADGKPLKTFGTVRVDIKIGTQTVFHDIVGADIDDSGILGYDFLEEHKCHLHIDEHELEMNGEKIPSIRRCLKPGTFFRIKDSIEVPEMSEMVIEVSADDENAEETAVLLEPVLHFEEKYGVKSAATLCSMEHPQQFIRIINSNRHPVKLYSGTRAAQGHPVTTICNVGTENKEDEIFSHMPVRFIGEGVPSEKQLGIEDGEQHEASSSISPERTKEEDKHQSELPDYLTELYLSSTFRLQPEQKHAVKQLLQKYAHVFQSNKMDLGQIDAKFGHHEIHTGDAVPVKQRPRRTPIAFKGEEEKEIEKMLEMEVIRPSTSPWASPVVLVRKKDGSTRFCIDYTKLNKLTTIDSYPLPLIDDCLESLAGATSFSTMDLASGYWQIPVKEADKPKTAFVTKSGFYEFNKMPFGLTNAPSTFERCMEAILRGCQWKTCLVYLDDIIVYGRTHQEHLVRLEEVLHRLQEAGLKLKPSKCHFFQEKLIFLGHQISAQGMTTDPSKTEAVRNWPPPKNIKEVRSFLGFCSYYRRYVKNFANLSEPISQLTRRDCKFLWTDNCQIAFEAIKELLIQAPVLAYPQDEGPFILDCDASDTGIGAVLSQIQGTSQNLSKFPPRTRTNLEKKFNGEEKVISYGSRVLTKEERNYCVTRRELLAVVNFVKQYRHFLLGRKFYIRTDHRPLQWIFSLQDPTGQTARWQETLASFDFELMYRPGQQHGNADGMSRRPFDLLDKADNGPPCGPCKKCSKQNTPILIPVAAVVTRQASKKPNQTSQSSAKDSVQHQWPIGYSMKDLQEKQLIDPDIKMIMKCKLNGEPRPDVPIAESPATRNLWLIWDSLILEDGVLWKEEINHNKRLVAPKTLQLEIMKLAHESILAGHLGFKRTYKTVCNRYYWFRMKESVQNYTAQCEICNLNKRPSRKPKGPLGHLKAGAPLDTVTTDLFGPLPETQRGNRYIMLITDVFSKWIEIIAIPDAKAETCAEALLNGFISRMGCPLTLHSDRGKNYESEVFQQLCHMLEIHKTRTTARHPRGNGMVERFNQTLITMIRSYLKGKPRTWDQHLDSLAGAYRATQHESTGLSPNQVIFGRETRMPIDIMFGINIKTKDGTPMATYVENLKNTLHEAHHTVRQKLQKAAERQENDYNVSLHFKPFKMGDVVLVRNEKRMIGINPKLQYPYSGPNVVLKKINDLNYLIQIDPKGKTKIVHYEKLKLYKAEIPTWVEKAKKDLHKE